MVASKQLINCVVFNQINQMGYKSCSGLIYNPVPIKTEEVIEGKWWWKRIYHRWEYISICTIQVTQEEFGKFEVYVEIPKTTTEPFDKNHFVSGVVGTLSDVGLDESLNINFVLVPYISNYKYDNVPQYRFC